MDAFNSSEKINEKDLPSIITNVFNDIQEIDKRINLAASNAKNAKELADTAKAKSTNWSWDGNKKKEAIEALQTATATLAEGYLLNIDAQKLAFENQQKMAKGIGYLLRLGLMNMAANRSIVRELELKIKNASKEKLSDLARQELINVIQQLKKQEDTVLRLDKQEALLKQQDTWNKRTEQLVKEQNNNINAFMQQCIKALNDIQNTAEHLRTSINNSLIQFDQKFSNLESNLKENITQEIKEKINQNSEHLHKIISNDLEKQNQQFSVLATGIQISKKKIDDLLQKSDEQQSQTDEKITKFQKSFNLLKQFLHHFLKKHQLEYKRFIDAKGEELTREHLLLQQNTDKLINRKFEDNLPQISERINELKNEIENLQIKISLKKNIFNSVYYKITIGIISISALICSLIL